MGATYRNSFWSGRAGHSYGPEHYHTAARPEAYRGMLIYQRLSGVCWDIVDDGVCIGQYAGPNGAKRGIDGIIAKREGK